MMNLRVLFVLILVFMVSTIVSADDNPETPFPVTEQCVVNATQPPDDWTYSGTLLMSGYGGIHAMQADWDTPRIVASFYVDPLGEPLNGGQLSPDQRWYGVPVGRIQIEPSLNRFWLNEGLRVYSLIDNRVLQFSIEDYADEVGYQYYNCCAWTHDTVQWTDNSTLVMGGLHFQLIEEEVTLAPFFAVKYFYENLVFSPDVSRVVSDTYELDTIVVDPYTPNDVLSELELIDGISWQHDSAVFIAENRRELYDVDKADYLSLYDRDGTFIERVFDQTIGRLNIDRDFSGRSEFGWSYDDRYFAFNYFESYSTPAQLFLLDMENKIAINTCLVPVSQPVWSPDAMQIAMLLDSPQSLRVVILDLEDWALYDVARHSRDTNMIGVENVLKPDMIGWRSGS